MSGHSKWATIKRKKGAEDAKRGKIFTRLARDITIAAREGGGDESANPKLKLAIAKARAANMPKENIERAIKKGTGELEGGAAMEELVYEGYGVNGIASSSNASPTTKIARWPRSRTCLTKTAEASPPAAPSRGSSSRWA